MNQAAFPLPNHITTQLHLESKGTSSKPKIKFSNPNIENYESNIKNASRLHKAKIKKNRLRTIYQNQLKGERAVICGSGSSLSDPQVLNIIKEKKEQGFLIVACKHAIRYLTEQDIQVDYAVTMDPSAHIARPDRKIYKAKGVTHIAATSSDPLLLDYLMAKVPYDDWLSGLSVEQAKRVLQDDYESWKAGDLHFPAIPSHPEDINPKVLLFHSACGVNDEVNLYKRLFKNADVMGGGYNVVNRAFSAMLYMGISEFVFAGVDCGWREDAPFYVNEIKPQKGVDLSDGGAIDGKPWFTRPDMMASAVSLVKQSRLLGVPMSFIGDTMPRSLLVKDDAFLDKMLEMIV